jgi:RNA polymerase sigma factor (sigma-70 family)
MMSLEQLLRAARDAEPGSWERLTPPLTLQLHRYFSRWFQPHDADDLSQITFATVFEKLTGFEPNTSLEGWVFGVARTLARREFRTRRRRAAAHEAAAHVPVALDKSISSKLGQAELGRVVMQEVEQLPDHLRVVIENDLADGDPAAFVEAHGITRTTLRTRRHRAHEQLEEQVAARRKTPSSPTQTPTP